MDVRANRRHSLRLTKGGGGKSTHILYLSGSTDTCAKKTLVKVEVLTQLLYSNKSDKVQVLKCVQSIKVKSAPEGHF